MSQTDQTEALLEALYVQQIGLYAATAASALMFYHLLSTISAEVQYICGTRFTFPTLFYVVMRYVFVLAQIITLWSYFAMDPSDEACVVVEGGLMGLMILITMASILVSALRTYAVYDGNWMVFILVCLAGLGTIIVDGRVASLAGYFFGWTMGCGAEPQLYSNLAQWNLISAGSSVAYISLVFLLNFGRTLVLKRQAAQSKKDTKLVNLILYDGSLYFLAMMVLIVIDICIVLVPTVPSGMMAVIPPIQQVLSIILMSKLMRNLRSDWSHPNKARTAFGSFISTLVVGNLGAPLKKCSAQEDVYDSAEEHSRASGKLDLMV